MTTPMSREQVLVETEILKNSYIEELGEHWVNLIDNWVATDAALRARVEEQGHEIVMLKEHLLKHLENKYNDLLKQNYTLTAKLAEVERERDDYKQREVVGYPAEQHFQLQQQLATLTRENERLRGALRALMKRAKAQWDHAADFAGDPPSKCTDPLYLQAQAALKETP